MEGVDLGPATPADAAGVESLLRAAFPTADEADLVAALRDDPAHVADLDLVAVDGGTVVGHVLFTRVVVPGTDRPDAHLVLAPLSVRPARQGEGIGSTLVREGLARARERGFGSVVLHGSTAYYPRFGFEPAVPAGLENPFDLPDEDFMACELRPGALAGADGPVRYPAPFQRL